MKKLIKKQIIGILLLTALFGCKKTLKEYNPSGLTAETAYLTGPGYETLVAGAYTYNRAWYGKEDGIGLAEGGTDLWTAGSESVVATSGVAGDNTPLITYRNLNSINGNVTRLWKNLYAGVNLCNKGIQISRDGLFTPPVSRLAELHFLRAFYYWHIVETWGGVHYTTDPTVDISTTANRTSIDKFYELILSDLKFAIENLSATVDQGRVNKTIAKAFLARIYLTRGNYAEAKALAQDVITNGGYTLESQYSKLWDMTNQRSKEVIWAINYPLSPTLSDVYNEQTNPLGYGVDQLNANGNPSSTRGNNSLHFMFIPGYDRPMTEFGGIKVVNRNIRDGRPFIRLKPTKYLMDLYSQEDSRFNGSFQTVWKLNFKVSAIGNKLVGKKVLQADGKTLLPYAQRDTAFVISRNPTPSPKYYTVNIYDTYNADGTSKGGFVANVLYPALLKFKDSTRAVNLDANDDIIQSSKEVIVLRLAEMHMIVAEAAFRLGDNGTAATEINKIRNRAAKVKGTMDVTDADITLDFILDERAREFAGENIRWFDLKRTGRLVDRVRTYNPDIAPFIQDFHVLRPIPQTQMDVVTNKDEFTQNPGY